MKKPLLTMDATREDLVRFVSDVRLVLEGPDGWEQDRAAMVQQETLKRLITKLRTVDENQMTRSLRQQLKDRRDPGVSSS